MGENRNAYRVLVGNPEGKTPLGTHRHRWDDIKMYVKNRMTAFGLDAPASGMGAVVTTS
jgi:hypothetical protein